jgi:hypothetical protein
MDDYSIARMTKRLTDVSVRPLVLLLFLFAVCCFSLFLLRCAWYDISC